MRKNDCDLYSFGAMWLCSHSDCGMGGTREQIATHVVARHGVETPAAREFPVQHVQFGRAEGPFSAIYGPSPAYWGQILPGVYRQTWNQKDAERFERIYGRLDARPKLSYEDGFYHASLGGLPVSMRAEDFRRVRGTDYDADLYGQRAEAWLSLARVRGLAAA